MPRTDLPNPTIGFQDPDQVHCESHQAEPYFDGISVKGLLMTPARAQDLLAKVPERQRSVMPTRVERYVTAMRENRWKVNGEPIILDDLGQLVNGQHRLHAVVKSGVTVPMLLVRGVASDDHTMDAIDTGYNRTPAQVLGMHGESKATQGALAHALRLLHAWDHPTVRFLSSQHQAYFDNQVAVDMAKLHPEMRRSILFTLEGRRLCNPSYLAFAHYIFSRIDPILSDAFFNALITGDGVRMDEPVYTLREKLIENRGRRVRRAGKTEILAWIINTWNMTRKGKRGTRLIIRYRHNEKFPKPE